MTAAVPTATTSPTVTAIVCCFTDRRRPEILTAVASLRAQTVWPDEIVVVVDHNPGLLDWLDGRLTGVRLLANAHERGLSGARNTGVEASAGDVVAFLDDDAAADPHWLAALVAEYVDPGVVAVGGRIDPDWAAPRPDWFPAEFGWVIGCSYVGQPTRRAAVRNVIGANMSFRRRVIDQVGGFRRELGRMGTLLAGCEETELCIRATAQTGGRVIYQPRAVVSHRVSADRGEWAYFWSRCVAEGRSKAVVAALAGSDQALSTERSYVTRVLPVAVLRGLRDGVMGDHSGFGRAAAITVGLTLTVAGYVSGTIAARRPPEPSAAGVWCAEIELSGPGGVTATVPHLAHQATARVLVRLHGEPLCYVTVPAAGGHPDRADVHRAAWEAAGDRIVEHLVADGHRTPEALALLPGPAPTCTNRVEPDEFVSVVVCTRERSEILGTALASLRGLTYPRLEVIVVDNAPGDSSTRDVVRQVQDVDERFRYTVEPAPGLSHARNAGLAHARGDYVAYTDDDVTVDPQWVDGLLKGFRTRPDVACVTGLVATASIDGPLEAYFDARAHSWWNRCRAEVFDMRGARPECPLYPYTPAMFGTGANVAFERSFLTDTGGFDVALGAGTRTRGGEDIDKFVDTLLRGRAIAYEPAAIVWHRHRGDRAGLLRQMFGYGSGLTAFVTKHLSRRETAGQVLRRAPSGIGRALRTRTETVDRLDQTPAPRGAAAMEALGLLAGPYLYVAARWANRR